MANVWDLIVRLTGDGQGLRDEIDQDKEKLGEFQNKVDELHGKDVDIKADTSTTQAKLDAVKKDLDEIKQTTLSFFVSDKKAEQKLNNLVSGADALRAQLTGIDVSVLDDKAQSKVEALKTLIDSLHDKTVEIRVNESGAGGAIAKADAAATGVGSKGRGVGVWGILGALGAGLLTEGSPGIIGAGGYGAVATGVLKPAFNALSSYDSAKQQYDALLKNPAATNAQKLQALAQMQQALAGLDSEQKTVVKDAQSFDQWWKGFIKQFEPSVVNNFTGALQGLQSLLTTFAPAIQGFGQALSELGKEAAKAAHSAFWQSFAKFINGNAKSSTIAFGQALGNLGKLFAALLQDLYPIGKTLLNIISALAKFAAGIASGNPNLVRLIALIAAGSAVFKGLSNVWSGLLGMNKKLIDGVVTFATKLGILKTAEEGATAATEGMDVAMDANLIGLVVLAIEALAAAAYLLVTHWKQVKKWAVKAWDALQSAWSGAGTWFQGVWGNVKSATSKGWSDIKKWLTANLGSVWAAVTKVFNGAIKWFRSLWESVHTVTNQGWSDIKTWLSNNIGSVWAEITKVFTGAVTWFSNIWNGISGAIPAAWKAISTALSSVAQTAYDGITGAFNSLGSYFTDLWANVKGLWKGFVKDAQSWGSDISNAIASGIQSALASVENALPGWAKSLLGIGGTTSLSVSSGAGSVAVGSGSVKVQVSGTITHNGKVQSDGLTHKAINQVNQHLNTQLQRKMRTT